MKISELKIIHILLVLALILWAYLFFDWQKTKYQLQFENWRGQVTGALNDINRRVQALEKENIPPVKPGK